MKMEQKRPLTTSRMRKRTKFAAFILRTLSFLVGGLILAAPHLVTAAGDEDEYLKQLSEEINKPEYLDQIEAEILISEKAEQEEGKTGEEEEVETDKYRNQSKFAGILKQNFPASFKIYSQLTAKQKQQVFTEYQNTKKLSAAKRKIVDLYLGF